MSISVDNQDKFIKLCSFLKKIWNDFGSASEFHDLLNKEFQKEDIKMFLIYFIEKLGENVKNFSNFLNDYLFSIIQQDPSIIFADIDLSNISQVNGARKIVEMSKVEIFNVLPVYSEKSSHCAMNVLIIILMNDDKFEIIKDLNQISNSPYFRILVSSGELFCPDKYKMAQKLFKERDPFDCSFYHLPLSIFQLASSLFPSAVNKSIDFDDKYKNLFFIFTVLQLVFMESSTIRISINNSVRCSLFSSLINLYASKPSYIMSHFLNTFPTISKNSSHVIHFSPSYEEINDNDEICPSPNSNDYECLLYSIFHRNEDSEDAFIFNSHIINEKLPNGIFPDYETAFHFLLSNPETFSIDNLIEEAIQYPSFTPEVGNIFMSALNEKDYETSAKIAIQILNRIDDIRITWIVEYIFFPIMHSLHECIYEVTDHHQFEVLFYLFISFFEGTINQGSEEVMAGFRKFSMKLDKPIQSFLENFLDQTEKVYTIDNYFEDSQKPIYKLLNFLKKCVESNNIDYEELEKYPYLYMPAFLWGAKTIHPNSIRLLSMKFPKYRILKRFFIILSSCYQNLSKTDSYSNLIFSIDPADYSYFLLVRFPPSDELMIRMKLLQSIQRLFPSDTDISCIDGIVVLWRAWIKLFTIERFVYILLDLLISSGVNKFEQIKTRSSFIVSVKVLAMIYSNPVIEGITNSDEQVEFNPEKKKFEKKKNSKSCDDSASCEKIDKIFSIILWSAVQFVNNYQGSYSDGTGFASFCLLLIISMRKSWKSEFKKVMDFILKFLKESHWKSLKYSFGVSFLYISTSVLEVQDLVDLEKFDLEFLQLNWKFGVDFFFAKAKIKKLKKMGLFSE